MKAELETHILINQEDLADGYFWIYTSYSAHANRVLGKYGKGVLETKESRSGGKVVEWKFKMSKDYLPRGGFTLRRGGKSHKPATEGQLIRLRVAREKQRAKKLHTTR